MPGEVPIIPGKQITSAYIDTLFQYYFDLLSKYKYFDPRSKGVIRAYVKGIKEAVSNIKIGEDIKAIRLMQSLFIKVLANTNVFTGDHFIMWPVVKAIMAYLQASKKQNGNNVYAWRFTSEIELLSTFYANYVSPITAHFYDFWMLLNSFVDWDFGDGDALYDPHYVVSVSSVFYSLGRAQNTDLRIAFESILQAGDFLLRQSVSDAYTLILSAVTSLAGDESDDLDLKTKISQFIQFFTNAVIFIVKRQAIPGVSRRRYVPALQDAMEMLSEGESWV